MRHRKPRSLRTSSLQRRSRVLLTLAVSLGVAAGGALVLTDNGAATPASSAVALDPTAHAAGLRAAHGSAAQERPGATTRAGHTPDAGSAPGSRSGPEDELSTLRHLAAVGAGLPDSAGQQGTGGSAASGAAAPGVAATAGGLLPDGGKKGGGADTDPANPNCTLVVPEHPTSARGLTTPYELTATRRQAGACHETNSDQSAFVEAAIIDTDTGAVSTYRPLVIDAGDRPAARPVPVKIPAHAVVAVWFGFNGDTLTLAGRGAGDCVNGLPGSPFGQFAYCNAPAFFDAANAAIAAGQLTVPELGTGRDGLPCPTTRDFSVVDQDQSDNLTTTYRIIDGRMAQDTPRTQDGTALTNGSDEGLLAAAIDPALGCRPFLAPDQTNGGAMTPALALNELSAAAHQANRMALVPVSDPMVLVDGQQSVEKTNLYRAGIDQPALPAGQTAHAYCAELLRIAPVRIYRDAEFLRRAASPSGGPGGLLQFLVTRLQTTVDNLGCLPTP